MRSLLFASAAIAISAVLSQNFIAQHVERYEPTVRAIAVAAHRSAAAVQASRSEGRTVEILAERDGHFYVDAEINYRPVRLMVDTGASVVALRRSDAEAMGIRLSRADFHQPVSTANGVAYAAPTAFDSVVVRDIEVRGVKALILPDEQLGVSLLGASFLNRLARYQVEGGTLIFEN